MKRLPSRAMYGADGCDAVLMTWQAVMDAKHEHQRLQRDIAEAARDLAALRDKLAKHTCAT